MGSGGISFQINILAAHETQHWAFDHRPLRGASMPNRTVATSPDLTMSPYHRPAPYHSCITGRPLGMGQRALQALIVQGFFHHLAALQRMAFTRSAVRSRSAPPFKSPGKISSYVLGIRHLPRHGLSRCRTGARASFARCHCGARSCVPYAALRLRPSLDHHC
jgi:hypothetical protein